MNLRLPLATAAVTVAATGAAAAATSDTFKLSFSPSKAGSSTAVTESGKFDGTRIVDRLTTVLPAGTKVVTSAAPRCSRTAAQLDASTSGNGGLCAANTKVGTGTGTATINGTVAKFTLDFFNQAKGMYVDLKVGGAVAYTSTYSVSGNRLTFDLGLAPKIKAKITAFAIKIAKKGTGGKAYVRTPKTCPSSGKLPASVITRAAGKSQTVKTTVACKA